MGQSVTEARHSLVDGKSLQLELDLSLGQSGVAVVEADGNVSF